MSAISNYRVIQVEIEDGVGQLAPSATVSLVPYGTTGIDGDSKPIGQITILDTNGVNIFQSRLPILNQRVRIRIVYNGNDLGDFFTGYVTHADDFTDTDKYTYRLTVSSVPINEPFKRQITYLMSSPDSSNRTKGIYEFVKGAGSACNVVVRTLGFPDYEYFGTFDCVRESFLSVLNQSYSAFGQFPYLNYYPRWKDDDQSISVFEVNYVNVNGRPYTLNNILSVDRTYEHYTSDHIIGDSDILCNGGEKYGELEEQQAKNDTHTARGTVTQVWEYSSKNNQQVAGYDTWVETETTIEYDLEVSKKGDGVLIIFPTLEENIAAFAGGAFDDMRILSTKILKRISRNFSQAFGKTDETTTAYTYEVKDFNNGVYFIGGTNPLNPNCPVPNVDFTKTVLVYEETYVEKYPCNEAYPFSLQKRWYQYNALGVVETTTTKDYNFWRDQWSEVKTVIEGGDPSETANAAISFFSGFKAARQGQGIQTTPKQPFGKYRTLNNIELDPVKFKVTDCNTPGTVQIDVNKGYFEASLPGSAYYGLGLLYQICATQQVLERTASYWEVVNARSLFDPYVQIGFPIKIQNRTVMVDKVTHVITEDSAFTTVLGRKVHQGS